MENLEQKSKSEDIKDESVELKPYATAFRVSVNIKYGDLRKKFNSYWKEHKKSLRKKFGIVDKNVKSKEAQKMIENNIGIEKLYSTVITDYVMDKLPAVLFVEEIEVKNFEPGETVIINAKIYEIPKVELNDGINMEVNMSNFKVRDPKENLKKRIDDIVNKYRKEVPYEGALNDNCNVVVDIISSKDGMPFPQMTITRKGIDIKNIIDTPKIKEAIIAHKKGDKFEVHTEDEQNSKIITQIKIWDSFKIELPEVNDDLAIKEGYSSLDELKKSYLGNLEEHVNKLKNDYVVNKICKNIINSMEFTAIPEPWLEAKSRATLYKHVNEMGGLDKALDIIGAESEQQVIEMFKAQAMTELVQFMALKKYAEINNINTNKNNMQPIAEHIIENARLINE